MKKQAVQKTKKEKKKTSFPLKKKHIWLFLFLVLLFAVIGFLLFHFFFSSEDYYSIESRKENIANTVIDDSITHGWLRVQGTTIDTPIIDLTTEVNNDTKADYLWFSPLYEEGQNRKVIYGHNIRNVSPYPEINAEGHFRFEPLMAFAYYDFAKENLYFQYSDEEGEALYKIYAVSFYNAGDEFGRGYEEEELTSYIEEAKYNSLYSYDVEVNEEDELLSLITCTRYFGLYEKTQFRVDARRVRENEKITKYKVETTSNYDIIK